VSNLVTLSDYSISDAPKSSPVAAPDALRNAPVNFAALHLPVFPDGVKDSVDVLSGLADFCGG
jgi:hypothetical protein